MKVKQHKVLWACVAFFVLLIAVVLGKYIYAVVLSVRDYKTMDHYAAKTIFINHQDDIEKIRSMLLADIRRSNADRVFLSTHVDWTSYGDMPKERQDKYIEILSRLPASSIYGNKHSVVFVLARIGFAGDTKGKGIAWYMDDNSITDQNRENISLGVDGWYYLHYR